MSVKSKKPARNTYLFMGLIGLWIIYTALYVILKEFGVPRVYVGFLSLTGEVVLDVIAALLTFYLWKKTTGQQKIIFIFFFFSFLLALVSDFSYNMTVNILGITHFTGIVDSIFDVPFLGFLILQLLAWIIIFFKTKPIRNNRVALISYIPILIIISIILGIFLFGFKWEIQFFSFVGLYITADTVLQVLGFVFALLCLAIALNNQIRLIAVGSLIIIASDFLVHFSILTQTLVSASLLEPTWILGLLLMVFGFYGMLKKPNLTTEKWLTSVNSVQAQCAFWSFLFCITSLAAFGVVSYVCARHAIFGTETLQNLPSILILFSIFAILISSIFAKVFSTPFGRIETVIDSFMQGKDVEISPKKYNSNIDEFEHLENFLTKAFEVLKEKNKAQRNLANCTSQVAHDVRKPFTMLKTMLQIFPSLTPTQTKQYSEDLDISIRKVEAMLGDIMEASREMKYELAPGNILSVLDLAIKDVSRYHPDKNIDFYYQLDDTICSNKSR